MTPEFFRQLVDAHDEYWASKASLVRRLARAYRCIPLPDEEGVVQSSRGYEFVEGYVSSLFSKAPSVVLEDSIRPSGNRERAEALVNSWLVDQHAVMTEACRVSVTFPGAWLKLTPCASLDPYQRVSLQVVQPWDVLIDRHAPTHEKMRWVSHRYWLPQDVAQEKWGGDDWQGKSFTPSLPGEEIQRGSLSREQDAVDDPHVQAYEIYSISEDRYYVWSPQYKNGLSWVQDGITIEVGGSPEDEEDPTPKKFTAIPFRSYDDEPVIPLIPLAMAHEPGRETEMTSPLFRVLDLVYEHAIIRTFQSRAVRKASRQWMIRKGALDEEGLSALVDGRDGEYIQVDSDPALPLSGAVVPVPHTPTPAETWRYIDSIDQDYQRGSILAPFTRGEATKATATEITALAAYSASEIGRMARSRDAMIEQVARVYLAMVRVYISDKGQADLIKLNGKLVPLRPEDLDANFEVSALDQGSTPLGEAAKKNELISLIPVLAQLGVPPSDILGELIRRFDLPPDWEEAAKPQPPPTMGQAQRAASKMEGGEEPVLPGEVPPNEQISRVLPEGGGL